jgi:N-acetylglutamate synthase-like GNAT family acetyltransferase
MMRFRSAELNDTETITALVNSAYRGDSSKAGWTTEADLLGGQRTDTDKIREMISQDHIELVLESNEIIGCVYLKEEKDALYFGMLTVRPTLQSRGTGKLLLNRVEEIAKEMGHKRIRMTVINSRQELIEFYERRGFKWTGETEPFPENDPRFGIPKTRLLFHVYEKQLSQK